MYWFIQTEKYIGMHILGTDTANNSNVEISNLSTLLSSKFQPLSH